MSSYYGLGADQILEYKVVTADGQLRIANEFANQDLFWALRGGGAGTWGVVVEATLKVSPFFLWSILKPSRSHQNCAKSKVGLPSSEGFVLQILAQHNRF
jgi:hypothetical protein